MVHCPGKQIEKLCWGIAENLGKGGDETTTAAKPGTVFPLLADLRLTLWRGACLKHQPCDV